MRGVCLSMAVVTAAAGCSVGTTGATSRSGTSGSGSSSSGRSASPGTSSETSSGISSTSVGRSSTASAASSGTSTEGTGEASGTTSGGSSGVASSGSEATGASGSTSGSSDEGATGGTSSSTSSSSSTTGTTSLATSTGTAGATNSTSAGASSGYTGSSGGSGSTTGGSTGGSTGGASSGAPYLTIPLTGCPLDYYYAPVSIAGQTFQMIFDTASTDMAVAMSSCTSCGVSPEYTAAAGSCSGTTSETYGDGQSWSAQVCTASVSVGGEVPAVSFDFAAITTEAGNFFNSTDCAQDPLSSSPLYQGILGLGPLNLDSIGANPSDAYFPALVDAGVTDTFAVLLCSTGGLAWFGGYDPQYANGPSQYTPMTDAGWWTVDMTDVQLGTLDLGGADAHTFVDTGTRGFYLPTSAFNALMNASDPGFTSVFGANTLNGIFAQTFCAAPLAGQTQSQIDAALPTLSATFPATDGGAPFTLTSPATQSYLVPVTLSGATYYCQGVGDSADQGGHTIMGGPMMRGNITVFDEGNRQIGFVPQAYCE